MIKTRFKQSTSTRIKAKTIFLYTGMASFAIAAFVVAFLYLNIGVNEIARAAVNDYEFTSSSTTYSAITGTLVSNSTSDDEQVFNNRSIGFTFKYEGVEYTSLSIATNGFIALGNSVTTSSNPISSGSSNNVISILGANLQAQTSSSLRILTSGTSPNRVLTVQWQGYRFKSASGESLSFQIKLYETSNNIQFVYGQFDKNGTERTAEVGLRAATNSDFFNRTTTDNWSTTSEGTSNSSSCRLRDYTFWTTTDIVKPSSGLTYTFAPPVPVVSDLMVNLAVNDATPCIGAILSYTINVANNGPDGASDVEVTSPIPAGLEFIKAAMINGNYNSTTGKWTLPSVPDGGVSTMTITAKVRANQSGAAITTNAIVTSTDNNADNNSSSITVNVGTNKAPAVSDIENQTTNYNTATAFINFQVSDEDTPLSGLQVTTTSSNPICIPAGNIVLQGTGVNSKIKITPGNNQSGTSTISVIVNDGTCTTVRSFVITVFRQTYTSWQAANIVVGQTNFTTVDGTTVSRSIAKGSNNTAVSSKGVLAVGSQTAQRVLIWNSVPTSNGVQADFVVGKANFTTSGIECTQSRTGNVDGVAFSPDGTKLLVSDATNNRVLIFNSIPTSNGANADVVIGQTTFTANASGATLSKLKRPTELLITPDGKLLITDRENHRILIFNKIPTANGATADLVIGQTGSSGTGTNSLNSPWNCSLAPDGKLLVADDGNNRILVFNTVPTSNNASASLVIGQDNFTTNSSGSSKSKFSNPGVTVSPSGMVAIADYGNHRVLIYNSVPTVNGAEADVVLGQPNFSQQVGFNNGSGATGGPSDRNMSNPYGINFDLNERLYVNGRGMHRVMIFGETPTEVSDLALTFSNNNSSPCLGSSVNYSINIKNNGPNEATNVIVTSALPNGFTLQGFTVSSGSYVPNSGFWTVPSIPNGSSATLTITGTINSDQANNVITAYANVRSNNQSDNNFANNAGSVNVTVANNSIPVIDPIADRTVDVGVSTGTINVKIRDESSANLLILTASSSNTALIPNTAIVKGGTGENRTLAITPVDGLTGVAIITVNVSDGTCSATKTFKVKVGNVWLGHTDDWNFARNWSSSIPTSSISVTVPSSPEGGNFPTVYSNTAVARNLTIEEGASLTVNPTRTLTINGNYINNGNEYTGSGNIVFTSSNAQTLKGKIGAFTVNNTNGVSLDGDVSSSETITLSSGNLIVGSNTLSLGKAFAGTLTNLSTTNNSSIGVSGTGSGILLPNHVATLNELSIDNPNGASLQRDLHLNGNLILASGALNLNGRSLTLAKDVITTNGTLTGSNTSDLDIRGSGKLGTLKFTSSPASAQTIRNFTINRTLSGEMTLGSNVTVSNQLTLTNGIIRTQNYYLAVTNTSPDAIIAPHADATDRKSFINGTLRRYIATINGNDSPVNYEFPVGCRNLYEWAQMNFTKAVNLIYLDVKFTTYSHESQMSLPNLVMGLVPIHNMINYGYWSFDPDNENNYTVEYDLTLRAQGHSNGTASSDHYTVGKRHDASSPWELQGEHNNSWITGKALEPIKGTRKKIKSFSDGTLLFGEATLPVQLRDFSGKFENKAVKLSWKTEIETNNSHFEIERSLDGEYFTKIGEVKGSGNSSLPISYAFIDQNVWENQYYYRLKQVDFDNGFKHSPIVFVQNKVAAMGLSLEIFPNPTSSDNINLNVSSPDKTTALKVFLLNIQGQVFQTTSQEGKDINAMFKVRTTGSLTPGAYYIKIQQGGSTVTKELIIKE